MSEDEEKTRLGRKWGFLMARKKLQTSLEKDFRINIKIRNEEELHLYREMRIVAIKRGISLRDLVFDLFRKESRGK